jgi:hypothetical protein
MYVGLMLILLISDVLLGMRDAFKRIGIYWEGWGWVLGTHFVALHLPPVSSCCSTSRRGPIDHLFRNPKHTTMVPK